MGIGAVCPLEWSGRFLRKVGMKEVDSPEKRSVPVTISLADSDAEIVDRLRKLQNPHLPHKRAYFCAVLIRYIAAKVNDGSLSLKEVCDFFHLPRNEDKSGKAVAGA